MTTLTAEQAQELADRVARVEELALACAAALGVTPAANLPSGLDAYRLPDGTVSSTHTVIVPLPVFVPI